jgi:signal transduction protein with GAF and PtsI domain
VNADRDLLRELAQLADELGPALSPAGHKPLLKSIIDTTKMLFGAAACSIALLDDDGETLEFFVASGAGESDVTGMRMPATQGIAGWVITSGQPISVDDVQRDPRFARNVAESTGYVPTSILAMPLETDRDVIGVISVLDRESAGEGAGIRDMELLAPLARQAALAIENSRVFTHLGQALFSSAADAAEGDLAQALREVAGRSTEPTADMAAIAALFRDLARAGPDERRLATGILQDFLTYATNKNRRR